MEKFNLTLSREELFVIEHALEAYKYKMIQSKSLTPNLERQDWLDLNARTAETLFNRIHPNLINTENMGKDVSITI